MPYLYNLWWCYLHALQVSSNPTETTLYRFWMFSLSVGCRISFWNKHLVLSVPRFWIKTLQKNWSKIFVIECFIKTLCSSHPQGLTFYSLANSISGLGYNWIGTILLTSVKALSDSFSDVKRKINKMALETANIYIMWSF